jgi:hypothetical protein
MGLPFGADENEIDPVRHLIGSAMRHVVVSVGSTRELKPVLCSSCLHPCRRAVGRLPGEGSQPSRTLRATAWDTCRDGRIWEAGVNLISLWRSVCTGLAFMFGLSAAPCEARTLAAIEVYGILKVGLTGDYAPLLSAWPRRENLGR